MKVLFKTSNYLDRFIKNNKSKTDKLQLLGVYELSCGSCEKVYVGQTGRKFGIRKHNYFRSYINKDSVSNYSTHLNEKNHCFNDDFKVLHWSYERAYLNALEFLEIYTRKNLGVLLNNQLDVNSSPLLNSKLR